MTEVNSFERSDYVIEEAPLHDKFFKILIVGGGDTAQKAFESTSKDSPFLYTDFLAEAANDAIVKLGKDNALVGIINEPYRPEMLKHYGLVVIAAEDVSLAERIYKDAAAEKILVSVKHPVESDNQLIAEKLFNQNEGKEKKQEVYWKKFASRCLFALACMLVGHLAFSYQPLSSLWDEAKTAVLHLDAAFGWMLMAGFIAQLVDGALGMGYGVMSTTILLSTGLNPAAISGSIHTAEMFSSGASGFSHYRFGNINKKLFKVLVIPGVLGAIAGSYLLCYVGEEYSGWIRPILSVYTLFLGARILFKAFAKRSASRKVKHAGWLAGAGGFLDSFGGGGWGPLVTSTLISKGKSPRFVIGTVSLTEFFVTLGSALTFFLLLGTSHIETIAGLIIGGLLAAPVAARLAGKLPVKTTLIGVGALVIFSSLRTLFKAVKPFL